MSVRSVVQAALDAALAKDKVYSHWQRKGTIKGENPKEYVVYTVDSDRPSFKADSADTVKAANVAVRYYHAFGLTEAKIAKREKQIEQALKSAGLVVTSGPFDLGDIDDVGFNTTAFECDCARWIDGEVEKLLRPQGG